MSLYFQGMLETPAEASTDEEQFGKGGTVGDKIERRNEEIRLVTIKQ